MAATEAKTKEETRGRGINRNPAAKRRKMKRQKSEAEGKNCEKQEQGICRRMIAKNQTVIQKGKEGRSQKQHRRRKGGVEDGNCDCKMCRRAKGATTERGRRSKGDIVETGFFGEASHGNRDGKNISNAYSARKTLRFIE